MEAAFSGAIRLIANHFGRVLLKIDDILLLLNWLDFQSWLCRPENE
jgi:hypothetical protein